MIDLSQALWRKSTRSGQNNAGCVEVATIPGASAVRDSKRPVPGAHLVVGRDDFAAFLADVKAGRFDL
jgi:hypothetical protein